MIELEKTYLAKYLPGNLDQLESKEIVDIYLPESSEHPKLRIRKNGVKYEITKKEPMVDGDASQQLEQTIKLTEEEFAVLQSLVGKRIRKMRYYYPFEGMTAEVDVFLDNLLGLVLVDFEFNNVSDKDQFSTPDFCLVDVTQEEFIAGGMICGKSYVDIQQELDRLGYSKLSI